MPRRAPVRVLARAPAARHRVVRVQPEPDDPVQPRAVERRHDEPQRPYEVGREVDVDLALEQRLAHEPEVEVLQVAQAAVHELARARRRPAGEVRPLDERDAVAARGGVERHARAGDPAADDQDVERFTGERGDGVGAWAARPARLPTWSKEAASAGPDATATAQSSRLDGLCRRTRRARLGFPDHVVVKEDWTAVLRIDETSGTLVAPQASGLVESPPDREELLSLVTASWDVFATELGLERRAAARA